MVRTFKMLVVLFLLYLFLQVVLKSFSSGHTMEYKIEKDGEFFLIKEDYHNNKEIETYIISINKDDKDYIFQTTKDLKKADTVVKDIKYTEVDGYQCLLPVFYNNEVILDIMCYQGSNVYDYNYLFGKSLKLDNWVNGISNVYSAKKFREDKDKKEDFLNGYIYPDNLIKLHFLGVESYKGVHTVNNVNPKNAVSVDLLENDVYVKDIAGYVGKFYVTANYEKEYEFSNFLLLDLTTNKKSQIASDKKISFDSYVMGIVDESMFVYDKKNNKQYQINVGSGKVIEIGNINVGVKFYNGDEVEWLEVTDMKNEPVFTKEEQTDTNYDKVEKILGEFGYTYYFSKNDKSYDVYIASTANPEFKKFIFKTESINRLQFIDQYLYIVDGESIRRYSPETGYRTIYTNSELEFNQDLKFKVYDAR